MAPDVPISALVQAGSVGDSIAAFLMKRRHEVAPGEFLSLAIPELLKSKGLWEILRHPHIHRLKASFLGVEGVQLIDIPVFEDDLDPERDETQEPARNYVVVLVAGLNNASLQAIEYAETLNPVDPASRLVRPRPGYDGQAGNRLDERHRIHPA